MTFLSRLFPRGMRRRWWLFRPVDALVALWPAPRARHGLLVVRMDGIGDMVMARAALDHYPAAFGVPRDAVTILGCHSWRALLDEVFAGFRVVTIDEHAFEKKALYRLRIMLWVRRQGFAVAVCDMFMRKVMTADSLVWASRAPERIVAAPFVTDRTRAEYAWYLARATRVVETGRYPTHEGLRHFTFLSALTGRPHPPETVRIPWRDQPPPAPLGGSPYVVMNFGSNEPAASRGPVGAARLPSLPVALPLPRRAGRGLPLRRGDRRRVGLGRDGGGAGPRRRRRLLPMIPPFAPRARRCAPA